MGLLKDNVIVYSYEESLKLTSFSFLFFFFRRHSLRCP